MLKKEQCTYTLIKATCYTNFPNSDISLKVQLNGDYKKNHHLNADSLINAEDIAMYIYLN